MAMVRFNPTALNFGYDFVLIVHFFSDSLSTRFLVMMVFGSEDVEQLSGKIDSIKLNEHVPSLSDCVNLALDIQHQAYGQVICSTCYAF